MWSASFNSAATAIAEVVQAPVIRCNSCLAGSDANVVLRKEILVGTGGSQAFQPGSLQGTEERGVVGVTRWGVQQVDHPVGELLGAPDAGQAVGGISVQGSGIAPQSSDHGLAQQVCFHDGEV